MKYIILALLITFLCNCGSNNQEQTATHSSSIPKTTDTLYYIYQEVKEISSYLSGAENDLDTAYYRITYPVFSNQQFNELTQSAVFLEGDDNPKEAAQAFIDGYNEFVEDEATIYVSAVWVKDIQSQVFLNTPRVLSLCTRFHEYTGGAHGHAIAIWSNFDVLEMKKISLNDLVKDDKLPELTQIVERHFRTIENLSDTTSLTKDFFFEHGIFALNDNFGLTENDLIFYYNEYEIQPYAKGSTMIRIPYAEIADILSNRGQQYINSIRID